MDTFKYRPLEGSRLAELQCDLRDCAVIFIGEVSFVSQAMLSYLLIFMGMSYVCYILLAPTEALIVTMVY